MIKNLFNIFVICAVLSINVFSQETNDLFPDIVNNWSKYNSSKTYVRDDLFILIDGGADLFFEYGFNKVITQRYKNGEKYIDAEIYEMNDSSSAYGIFSLQTFRTGEKIKFNSEAFAGEGFMLFWKGRYYISLSMRSSESSGEDTKDLLDIADKIDSKMDAAGKPLLAAKLAGKNSTKVVYVKGNLGLYNLHIPEADDLVAVKEGFYFEKDNSKNLIFRFNNEDETIKQFNISYENLNKNKEFKQRSKGIDSFSFNKGNNEAITVVRFGNYITACISADENQQTKLLSDIKNIVSK